MHQKCGLIRGVASLEGENIMEMPYLLHGKVAFVEGVASLQGGLIRGGPLYCDYYHYKCTLARREIL